MRNHNNRLDFSMIIGMVVMAMTIIMFIACIGWGVYNEGNRLSAGIVIDKSYNPAYMTTHTTKIGENTVATPQYYAASYQIKLQGEKDGETVTYWRTVTESEYHAVNIGDYYPPEEVNHDL